MADIRWTPEQDSELRRLIAKGYSATRIGVFLGRSRNSVIGRSHRLKTPCDSGRNASTRKGKYTGEEDAMIANMAKSGKSGRQIAEALGRDVHSVNARARLIGTPVRGKSGPEKKTAVRVVSFAAKSAHVTPAVAVEPLMVSLLDLRPNMCRFPLGDPRHEDFGFCGLDRHTGSYCKAHARLCYTAPEMRRAA